MSLVRISRALTRSLEPLRFAEPVTHVYNPLVYARAPHEAYLKKRGGAPKQVVLLGMNPGPFGMGQTGVPFGDVALVRDWIGVEAKVGKPLVEHPKRPVSGFDCARSEVSGTRVWSWARDRFGSADVFFERFFVVNYCPLLFMEESGRNRTPDKLPAGERRPLLEACDTALVATVKELDPEWVVGVGGWARKRADAALAQLDVKIGTVLHPSPASPKANRGWAAQADSELRALGIAIP